MGTGKTTVGKLLADYLNYRFIDTDELIESRNKRSISDIFQELGEEAFREMERAIVKEIAELDGVVISTGGRLMLDPENVNALSRNSRVLCLVATPDEILTRVSEDQGHKRPLLSVPNPKQRIIDLLQERNDKYRRFPQIITDEKKPADIAKGLVEFINTSPKSLTVENPQSSYEYVVGAGLLPFIRQLTGMEGEIVIITDEIVNALYGPSCSSMGHIIEIPSGRQHKSLVTVQAVYDQLLDKGFDRSGTIISLGGSVVGDIAGYVAATYMRGVNLVQCPTSLIATVDTSVGGKTSLDLPQGKNMIGVYKQPIKVIADVATLQTLPQVDFASGMAEVIKHGLIAESNLLEQVEQGHWAKNWNRSPSYVGELQRLVAQAIQVKINIVQVDPFEQGQRSILNLGHTFAYAIEQVSKNAYRHGEAVSMGLIAAANLSARLGYCDISLQRRIEDLLKSVSLPTRIPSHINPDALLQAMQHDKKKRAGQLRFVLLRGIGQAFVSDEVSAKDIKDTVSALSR
jgi:3-dehydroquinate synthase